MVYKADYSEFLDAHIESGADISMMYHSVDNAKDAFLYCNALNIKIFGFFIKNVGKRVHR